MQEYRISLIITGELEQTLDQMNLGDAKVEIQRYA